MAGSNLSASRQQTSRDVIADDLRLVGPEFAAAQARRVAPGLLATGPLVGLALAVACPALGLTVVATGRLGRRVGGWLGRHSRITHAGRP
jgi:hypothetical protein